MNSTPGPVIFLLIVVPGRAIPSLNFKTDKMEAWDFAARLYVRGTARGRQIFSKRPDVKTSFEKFKKKNALFPSAAAAIAAPFATWALESPPLYMVNITMKTSTVEVLYMPFFLS
jgi:hypothetical protein